MVKEDSNQVSASFEAVQCILSSILSPSIFRLIGRHFDGSPILCPINATSSSSYVNILSHEHLIFLLRDFTYVYDQVRITITAETGVKQTEVDCELTNGTLSSRY
jgi:hypothetical protein